MAEVLALVASIVEVASFGLRLSRTLHDYGSSVVGAEKRMKGLDKDIVVTSRVISELGNVLKDTRTQALVSEESINLARDAVAECDAVFQAMEDVIANIRKNGIGKWKIYFRESKIEFLRSNLDRMKGNLQLLMGVIIHATQISTEHPDKPTLDGHRMKIRELMIEKEMYTQRYLQEKEKYDALLAKVNSTSTLGSILTTQSATLDGELSGTQPAFPLQVPTHCGDSREENGPAIYRGAEPVCSGDGASTNNTFNFVLSPAAPARSTMPTSDQLQGQAEAMFVASGGAPSALHASGERLSLASVPSPRPRPSRPPDVVPDQPTAPQKTKSAKEHANDIGRGAGYALLAVVAVVFFPITVPLYILFRCQRKAQKQKDVEAPPPVSYMHPISYQGSEWEPYASTAIPAELMGIHELDSSAPELDLTSRLTRLRLESGPRIA